MAIPKSFSRQGLLAAVSDHIHLGLDLSGGTHLILQVQVNDAVNVVAQNAMEVLKEQLRNRKIDYADITQPDQQNNPDHLVLKGMQPAARSDLLTIVQEQLPEYDVTGGPDNTWNLSMKPSALSDLKSKAVDQAIETIRNRVDALGVSEPTIEQHGLRAIPDSGATAGCGRFRAREGHHSVHRHARDQAISRRTVSQRASGAASADTGRSYSCGCDSSSRDTTCPEPKQKDRRGIWSRAFLRSAARICGTRSPAAIPNGQPSVTFSLTGDGGQRFFSFTSAHVGDSLAVVLDNKVQEVANIKEPIRDQGSISGGRMSEQQAKDLSMILRSGALPASIKYLQEETVGPSLGRGFDSFGRAGDHHRHGGRADFHAGLLSRRRH